MNLPIRAYPVIDRDNKQDIFPKLINFGKVYLHERELKVDSSFHYLCSAENGYLFDCLFEKRI